MVDNENEDTWKIYENRPITFESRIKDLMLPGMKAEGLEGRKPDMVVISSLFWDEDFIYEVSGLPDRTEQPLSYQYGRHTVSRNRQHTPGFFYTELQWHRSRVHKFINTIRGLYGQDTPLMFRTRQIRKNQNGQMTIFQLDQSCRAISKELGLRLFTWGGKLEGYMECVGRSLDDWEYADDNTDSTTMISITL
jgi:hypothetical protein